MSVLSTTYMHKPGRSTKPGRLCGKHQPLLTSSSPIRVTHKNELIGRCTTNPLSGPHPTQIWPARSRTRPWVVARPNLPRAQKTIGAPARPVNCGVDPARICVGRAAIAASSLPPRVPCAPAAACLDACMRQERGKEGEASGYGEMIGNGGIQFSCECGLV